jgi:hypothetical protein
MSLGETIALLVGVPMFDVVGSAPNTCGPREGAMPNQNGQAPAGI